MFVYNRLYKLWLCQFDMVDDINHTIKYLILQLHVRFLQPPPVTDLTDSVYITNQDLFLKFIKVHRTWVQKPYYVGKEIVKIDSTITQINYDYSSGRAILDFEKSKINSKYIKQCQDYYIEY